MRKSRSIARLVAYFPTLAGGAGCGRLLITRRLSIIHCFMLTRIGLFLASPHLQAELGVGDCGGLRYIPGMTKSGVQKRPEWMDKLFGMEGQE